MGKFSHVGAYWCRCPRDKGPKEPKGPKGPKGLKRLEGLKMKAALGGPPVTEAYQFTENQEELS